MKIQFICPNRESLGVGYLSACLNRAGHQTEALIDPTLFDYNQLIHNKFLDKIFTYEHIILDKIKNTKVDLIGFTVFHDNFEWAIKLATKIKKIKNTPVIFGGLYPTFMPEKVMKEQAVDMLCIGEGEEPIVELANSMRDGKIDYTIQNIWFKNNGKIIKNSIRPLQQNLDRIPFWNRDIFLDQCSVASKVYPVITSRNCPFACTYCSNISLKKIYQDKGKFFRRRDPEYVIKELMAAKQKYGVKKVIFYDQNFNYDKKWLEQFAPLYKQKIGLPFFCFVYPTGDEKGIELLKFAGCAAVNLGIESVIEKIRRKILKRYTPQKNITNTIKFLRDRHIYISANVLFGLPMQTEQEKIETVRFFIDNKVDLPNICWLRYYPESEIFKFAKNKNLLSCNQISLIENKTYSRGISEGDTFEKKYKGLHNLITLSNILPRALTRFILEKKLYCYFSLANQLILKFAVSRTHLFSIKTIIYKRPIYEMSFLKFYTYFAIKKLKFFIIKNHLNRNHQRRY